MKFSDNRGSIKRGTIIDMVFLLCAVALLIVACSLCYALIKGEVTTDETSKKIETLEHKCDSLQREIDLIAE